MANNYRDGGDGMVRWCEEHVCIPIYHPFASRTSKWCLIGDLPDDKHPVTGKSYKSFWLAQAEIFKECLQMEDGEFKHKLIIFCWMRGEGKCQAKGSKVLMYDGTVKNVEDVVVGDHLMGDDNMPRTVLSLASGKEEMFEVVPNRGESLTVTGDHILSLKHRRNCVMKRGKPFHDKMDGQVIDISVNEYQKQNPNFKSHNLLFRVPVDWKKQKVPIDPYFLGQWLGDGSSDYPHITTMEPEVVDYLYKFAEQTHTKITVSQKPDNKAATYKITGIERDKSNRWIYNPVLEFLKDYNLRNNKHIPQIYKINSREVRLKLLAGLLDSDGYVNRNSIQITLKSKQLSEDILFLARSLGFHAEMKQCEKRIKDLGFVGEYYRIGISGDCSIVPSLLPKKQIRKRSDWKDVTVSTIKEIKSAGVQEYYGFTLTGNGRYVTGDFTVTHNSLAVCLIQLWKFFNWPRQQIVLGANSKEQTKFVHYDIMRDIILNSPKLRQFVGDRNIQEKEIRLADSKGRIKSAIRAISSFSGIVSNVTGYTFSEMFDMKKPKFFVQLDGSTRAVPNALGTIDTTVSSKDHILHELYQSSLAGEIKSLYYSYRFSDFADVMDYWNPNMDQRQLNDYRMKFPFGEFERYFLNKWSAGSGTIFTEKMIKEIGIFGCQDGLFNHTKVTEILDELEEYKIRLAKYNNRLGIEGRSESTDQMNEHIIHTIGIAAKGREKELVPTDDYYQIRHHQGTVHFPQADTLGKLTDLLDTDWAILASIDFADPLSMKSRARSIVSVIAKGLIGSRSNPLSLEYDVAPKYIYLLLYMCDIEDHSITNAKSVLDEIALEYDGIDCFCAERFRSWDLKDWCEERNTAFEAIYPNYARQKEAFKEFYILLDTGRFKAPTIPVQGSRKGDIFREELEVFEHVIDSTKINGWFGSPEKQDRQGVQDDSIYSVAWCIYGGRFLNHTHFKPRKGKISFGEMIEPKRTLLGVY